MVRTALPDLPLDEIDLLVVENVGNLVCPAEFRIGEDAKAMICSVTEGEDKPLKYPLMFRTCELVVVNKIDLLSTSTSTSTGCSTTSTPSIRTSSDAPERQDRRGGRGVPLLAGRGRRAESGDRAAAGP